jgi:D-sedoheptulose 7-phosphate isomerase
MYSQKNLNKVRDLKVPNFEHQINSLIQEHKAVVENLDEMWFPIAQGTELILGALRSGNKILLCGNGGSAADAQHIAAELVGRFKKERKPLPALALHVNTSSLTAIGNDYSYDQVFAREVLAHGRSGDVLIAITTSGNSKNILQAVQVARENNICVVGLTGATGGNLKSLCEVCLCVPSTNTPRIQEMHILIGHIICQLIEDAIC